MTGNGFGDEKVAILSEMLKDNTTLTKLHLQGEEEGQGKEKQEMKKSQ